MEALSIYVPGPPPSPPPHGNGPPPPPVGCGPRSLPPVDVSVVMLGVALPLPPLWMWDVGSYISSMRVFFKNYCVLQ